ncbi:CenpB-DNA-bind-domain-containing protein [Myriangium duriaei CBS 260.36]|uniref:CenpB-DNA-bind-domain-containing protein n=1 Tax=Myriangium duriaei CBS 260.36 TaxID=1168546 RepID=A0A9P4IUZ1_9PEZI|nr:CenpB-DNA-bind-domain-containing protein [Myriangium duriaei CBS 260.36]
MPPTPIQRRSITNAQRLALRNKRREDPDIPQKQLCQWFEAHFNQPIKQSTVSDCLSPRYAELDSLSPDALNRPDQRKRRRENFPQVEDDVYQWFSQREADGIATTGEQLQARAREVWTNLAFAHGWENMPKFSNGWLENFRDRHGMKKRRKRNRRWGAGVDDSTIQVEDDASEHSIVEEELAEALGPEDDDAPVDPVMQSQARPLVSTPHRVAPPVTTPRSTAATSAARPASSSSSLSNVSAAEALQCLAKLRLHEELAEDCDFRFLLALDQQERVIRARHLHSLQQQWTTATRRGTQI